MNIIKLFVFLVLSGCVPNATVYYRPTVDVESTHEKGHCVPTERYVHFTIKSKDQTFKVRGYGNTYSNSYGEVVEFQFVISGKWSEIKYINDEFYMMVPDTNKKINPIKIYAEV